MNIWGGLCAIETEDAGPGACHSVDVPAAPLSFYLRLLQDNLAFLVPLSSTLRFRRQESSLKEGRVYGFTKMLGSSTAVSSESWIPPFLVSINQVLVHGSPV